VSPDELDLLYDSDDRRAPRESDEEAAAEHGTSAMPRASDKQRALEARIAERKRLTAKAADDERLLAGAMSQAAAERAALRQQQGQRQQQEQQRTPEQGGVAADGATRRASGLAAPPAPAAAAPAVDAAATDPAAFAAFMRECQRGALAARRAGAAAARAVGTYFPGSTQPSSAEQQRPEPGDGATSAREPAAANTREAVVAAEDTAARRPRLPYAEAVDAPVAATDPDARGRSRTSDGGTAPLSKHTPRGDGVVAAAPILGFYLRVRPARTIAGAAPAAAAVGGAKSPDPSERP
jgi:hypothetical protein